MGVQMLEMILNRHFELFMLFLTQKLGSLIVQL